MKRLVSVGSGHNGIGNNGRKVSTSKSLQQEVNHDQGLKSVSIEYLETEIKELKLALKKQRSCRLEVVKILLTAE